MNKKIALVTGANRGIGLEICRQLAKAGFKVILTSRNETAGEKAVREINGKDGDVVFHQLDLNDSNSIIKTAEFIKKNFGLLDILVNNAAIIVNGNNSEKTTVSELRKTFDTNFFGAFEITRALLPLLKKSADGRIINISSGMGSSEGGSGHLAYRTSKSALNGLTVTMASDLSGTNVKVNAMCPGWVRTDMGGKGAPRSVEQGADTALWLATEKNIPSGKFFRDRQRINW